MAIWELAPGSPWNAIFLGLVMPPWTSRSGFGQYAPGSFKVRRRIDAARHGIYDGDVDPQAGLKRPKLLQFLLLFQRGGGKGHETLQRRAAIGIEADVMVARSLAPGGRGTREVERAQPPLRHRRADYLHYVRVRALFLGVDFGCQRRDSDRGVGQRAEHAADIVGQNSRKIALQIDDDFGLAPRIELAERL